MNINELINDYYNFVKSNISINEINGFHEITTPFLDHFNDYIQVYVTMKDDEFIITDDSYIISNLKVGGLSFSEKRTNLVNKICTQFGAKLENDEILIRTNKDNFGAKLDAILQCIIKIDDLCYTSRENVANFFSEDVKKYFNEKELYFTENVSLVGKSGFSFNFDMSFQRTKNKSTRWVNIINKASKTNCIATSFGWEDTVALRSNEEIMYVIINDKNPIDNGVIDGFRNLNIMPIFWSKIDNHLDLFNN